MSDNEESKHRPKELFVVGKLIRSESTVANCIGRCSDGELVDWGLGIEQEQPKQPGFDWVTTGIPDGFLQFDSLDIVVALGESVAEPDGKSAASSLIAMDRCTEGHRGGSQERCK